MSKILCRPFYDLVLKMLVLADFGVLYVKSRKKEEILIRYKVPLNVSANKRVGSKKETM